MDEPTGTAGGDTVRLWLAGALVLVPAVLFAARYPLAGRTGVLTDIGKMADYGRAEFAGYVGGVAAMFAGCVWGARLSRRVPARRAVPIVLTVGVLAALAFAFMYPATAIDLFIATVRSREFTAHGANPLAVPPNAFPGDDLMRLASAEWADNVSPYGPLWTLVAAPATALAGDRFGLALALGKALALAATLGCAWAAGTAAEAARPGDRARGALLWLWNPLVLWEGVGNAHNDVVMMLPVLLAILAWRRRRDPLVLPLLTAAALVKWAAVPLLPLALVALWRRGATATAPGDGGDGVAAFGRGAAGTADGRRAVGVGLLLSAAVAAAALAPFWDLRAVAGSIAGQGSITLTSPASLATRWLREGAGLGGAATIVRVGGAALFGAGVLAALARLWRRPEALPRVAFEVTFLLLLVATWNFRAWYVVWLVGLAAVLPARWPAIRAGAWSAGGLAGYALFIWLWKWNGWAWPTAETLGVLVMVGPAVAATAAELAARRRTGPDDAPPPLPLTGGDA